MWKWQTHGWSCLLTHKNTVCLCLLVLQWEHSESGACFAVLLILSLDDLRWWLWLVGLAARSLSDLYFFFCYDFGVRPWQGSPRDCESPKHPPILLFPRVLFLGCPPRNTTPSDPPVSVSLVGQEFKVSMTHFTFTHKQNRLGLPIVDRKKIT